jgi:hypothetical protein
VVPVLETIDSVTELKEAVADPAGFLERLASAGGPAAKKLAIMHLRPPLTPHLHTLGLEWADVVPVLEAIDSIDELREAIDDPQAILGRVVPEIHKVVDGAVPDTVFELLLAPEHDALQLQFAPNSTDVLRRKSLLVLDHVDGDDVLPVDSVEELKEYEVVLSISDTAPHSAEDHDQRLRRLSTEAIKMDVEL